MLKEYEERINNAKNKQFKIFERFHIGDKVYPFWLHGLVVYGTVTDIDTVARKIFCDFNGVTRQFQPEDLMHVNSEIVNSETLKKRTASARKIDRKEYGFYVVLEDGSIESGWEYKEDANDRKKELADESIPSKVLTRRSLGDKPLDNANWHKGAITASAKDKSDESEDGTYSKFSETHLSPDTDNGIKAICKKCGGEIAVSYDGQHAKSDFVCTKCGIRISEDDLSEKTKKAMRLSQQKNLFASTSHEASNKELGQELARIAKELIKIGYMNTNADAMKRDIESAKRRLMAEARSNGVSKDFGNDEIRALQDKYDIYNWKCARMLQEFQVWCMNYGR